MLLTTEMGVRISDANMNTFWKQAFSAEGYKHGNDVIQFVLPSNTTTLTTEIFTTILADGIQKYVSQKTARQQRDPNA